MAENIETYSSSSESLPVLSKSTDLFKRVGNSWQFFFRNEEKINDIVPLKFVTNEGLFLISDNKVIRWTNYIPAKRVYLKVKDQAGNESDTAIVSLNLESIKDFIPSGRILDIDEYGKITYSFDSFDKTMMYSGDMVETEIGIYESEIFNGTNNLVSWRSITWEATEPINTSVSIQIRSGATEDSVLDADWSEILIKNNEGYVAIEYLKDQFIQFRAILTSRTRNVSPSLHSVTIRNLTSAATHFFTTNFVLPKKVISGILTDNAIIPVSADIVFGINTKNSVNFADYQIIEPNRIFTANSSQFGTNLRVGVKFITPGIASQISQDPYNEFTHSCIVNFNFVNTDVVAKTFHFRISFYNDVQHTQLAYRFFTGTDQTGWSYSNDLDFPSSGIVIPSSSSRNVIFTPGEQVIGANIFYILVEAFDGSLYEDVRTHDSYVCSVCDPQYDPYCTNSIPILKNFAIVFSLEDGTSIKINT
jgi:hypothetical protein